MNFPSRRVGGPAFKWLIVSYCSWKESACDDILGVERMIVEY